MASTLRRHQAEIVALHTLAGDSDSSAVQSAVRELLDQDDLVADDLVAIATPNVLRAVDHDTVEAILDHPSITLHAAALMVLNNRGWDTPLATHRLHRALVDVYVVVCRAGDDAYSRTGAFHDLLTGLQNTRPLTPAGWAVLTELHRNRSYTTSFTELVDAAVASTT